MSIKPRSLLKISCVILFILLVAAALPFMLIGGHKAVGAVSPVYADESTVSAPTDAEVDFHNMAWSGLDSNLTLVRLENGKGEDFTDKGAKDAGVYKYTVVPAEGKTWEDGTNGEKTFKLTINKVKLVWTHTEKNIVKGIDGGSIEFGYDMRENRISEIEAQGGGAYYNYQLSNPDDMVVKNAKDETVKNVTNAGEYTFTVKDADNFTNPELKVIIVPAEYNLKNLKWVLESNTDEELRSGTVYEYKYTLSGVENRVYTTSMMTEAPYTNWNDWEFVESTTVNYAIATYKDSLPRIVKLRYDQSRGDAARFNAEYSGQTSSEGKYGKFTASAKITSNDNYTLAYTSGADSPAMDIIKEADGTFTVTKTWYVANYINEFLDISSLSERSKVEYTFPEQWTFGQLEDGAITAPCLAHGDEIRMGQYDAMKHGITLDSEWETHPQPDGYSLSVENMLVLEVTSDGVQFAFDTEKWQSGEEDVVTFELKRGETIICRHEPRSRLSYYLNKYTPAGEYEIEFHARTVDITRHNDWWNGIFGVACGKQYFGTTVTYKFKVNEAPLDYDDSLLNFKGNAQATPFEVNIADIKGDYANFFAVTAGKVKMSDEIITADKVKASDTYWSTVAESNYDAEPYLTYHMFDLAGTYDDSFFTEASGEWSKIITKPDAYDILYRINMKNYSNVPSWETRFEKYFKVFLYEVLPVPTLTNPILRYTGEVQVVEAAEDVRYSVTNRTATEVGDYKVMFTILSPNFYHWEGVEGAVCEVGFTIAKGLVVRPQIADKPYTGEAYFIQVPVLTGKNGAPLYTVELPQGADNGLTNIGEYEIVLKLTDPARYEWCDENGEVLSGGENGETAIYFKIGTPQPKQDKNLIMAVIYTLCGIIACAVIIIIIILLIRRKKRGGGKDGGNAPKPDDGGNTQLVIDQTFEMPDESEPDEDGGDEQSDGEKGEKEETDEEGRDEKEKDEEDGRDEEKQLGVFEEEEQDGEDESAEQSEADEEEEQEESGYNQPDYGQDEPYAYDQSAYGQPYYEREENEYARQPSYDEQPEETADEPEEPYELSDDEPAEATEEPVEQPEESGEEPAEEVEEPVDEPAEATEEAAEQEPEETVEEPVDEPAEATEEAAEQEPEEQPEETFEEPEEQPEETVEEPVDEPVEATEEAAEQEPEEQPEEAVEEPAETVEEQPADDGEGEQ